eukprot:scaffold52559_cov64-Attheya_sp.AAC.1
MATQHTMKSHEEEEDDGDLAATKQQHQQNWSCRRHHWEQTANCLQWPPTNAESQHLLAWAKYYVDLSTHAAHHHNHPLTSPPATQMKFLLQARVLNGPSKCDPENMELCLRTITNLDAQI